MTVLSSRENFLAGFIRCALAALSFAPAVLQAHPTYQQLAAFSQPPQYVLGSLTDDGAGFLWGTSGSGGAFGWGTVFKLNKNTGEVTIVIDFTDAGATNKGRQPDASLVKDGAGFMWGTTESGGTIAGGGGDGTVFKVNIATGELTTMVIFTGSKAPFKGASPLGALVRDSAGYLWGTTDVGGAHTSGTIFKINIATGAFKLIAEFNGKDKINPNNDPACALCDDGHGFFWGTTGYGGQDQFGTVFKVDQHSGKVTTVVIFADSDDPKGAGPGTLASDGAGFLWGTTFAGSTADRGTIFKINTATGALTTVVRFGSVAGHGDSPAGGMVSDGAGNMWGTTTDTAVNGNGTIFKINTANGTITTVATFTGNGGALPGRAPVAELVNDGAGHLLGTTSGGVDNPIDSTAFSVTIATEAVTTLAIFNDQQAPNKGRTPHAPVFDDGAGHLWGTTYSGGATNLGTVFKIDQSTGAFTTVVDFDDSTSKGAHPDAPLVSDGAGFLWGSTFSGGSSKDGTVFKIDAVSGALTTVAQFNNVAVKGIGPSAALVPDGVGFLWGSTTGGDDQITGSQVANGTIFKIETSTGTLTSVAQLGVGGLSGGKITAPLVNDGAGHFLGILNNLVGGAVFSIGIADNVFTKVGDLPFISGTDGSVVDDGLGYLWGTLNDDSIPGGIFKMKKDTGDYSDVVLIKDNPPAAGLIKDSAGQLWGTTRAALLVSEGSLFKIDPATGILTTVIDFTGAGGTFPGSDPRAELLFASNGVFYGTTAAGGSSPAGKPLGGGTVFRLDTAAGGQDDVFDFFVKPDMPQTLDVLANDTSTNNYSFTITSVFGATGGTVEIINGGTALRYTAGKTFAGTDTFTYTFSDGHGGTSLATVHVGNPFQFFAGAFQNVLLSNGAEGDIFVNVMLGKTGSFSIAVKDRTGSYSTKSVLDMTGHGTATLARKAPLSNLQVTLALSDATGVLHVSVDDGSGPIAGDLLANQIFPKTAPAPVQAATMIIESPAQVTLTQATATATVSGGALGPISVSNAGAGYFTTPLVTIADPTGKGAVATATVSNGVVDHITVTKAGTGYSATPTVTLAPPSGLPRGTGYATIAQSKTGALKIVGKTGGGVPFSAGSNLTTIGAHPGFVLYSTLNKQPGWRLYGQLAYAVGDFTFDGMLKWEKPTQAKAQLFDTGFDLTLPAHGANYRPPPNDQLLIGFSAHGGDILATLNDGGLSTPFTKTLTLTVAPQNKFTVDSPAADKFKIGISAKTGLFTGSVILPGSAKPSAFSGVVVFVPALDANENIGLGLFQSATGTGTIRLDSQ